MSRFVSRSQEFQPADEGPTPATAAQLLELLQVDDKPPSFQQVAVRDWLRTHPASPILLTSLHDHGLLSAKAGRTPIGVLAAYVATAGDELVAEGRLRSEDEQAIAEAWLQLRIERDLLSTGGAVEPQRRFAAVAGHERSNVELASPVLDVLGRQDATQRAGKPAEIRLERMSVLLQLLENAAHGDQAAGEEIRNIFAGVTANLRRR